MKLYSLGKVPWEVSQLIYHALAELGREALSLVSPATPYVCVGFHQDAAQEVDLDYCEANGIPVFKRDLGGGAVYLDGSQLFFHLILCRDNPVAPKRREAFYRKFLQPVVNVYRRIGVPAEYKPVNDVISGTRKISGTGVGEIGDCVVFVGNVILDFDYRMMSRVLNVPDDKFRDKVHKTLRDHLSTVRRELGEKEAECLDEAYLNGLMAEEFQHLLGPMEPTIVDRELELKMDELRVRMLTDEWLFQRGKKQARGRDVKIRAGIKMIHRVHKALGGLIRADFEMNEGLYGNVSLSGDFFCYPASAIGRLEARLEGRPVGKIEPALENFYREEGVETPGIEIADWKKVLEVNGA